MSGWTKFIKDHMRGTCASMMEELAGGIDVPILTLYCKLPSSSQERVQNSDQRYRQQVVGARISRINRILQDHGKPYEVRPGVARTTYRLYRTVA